MKKFQYEGYIDYPDIGRIYDADVYKLIKKHSRLIDRLCPTKMVEMSLLGQCIFMHIFDNVDLQDPSWKFYGKKSRNLNM